MADWSVLPADLLGLILQRLNLVDYLRLQAVCNLWRSSCTARHPALHTPWLMLPGYIHKQTAKQTYRNFFNLSEKRFYEFKLSSDVRNSLIVGSSHGWVGFLDECCEFHLLNPFSGTQIKLPFFRTSLKVFMVRNLESGAITKYLMGDLSLTRAQMQKLIVKKAIWSKNPSQDDDYAVMINGGQVYNYKLVFFRAGDEKWTTLEGDFSFYDDFVYYKEQFYAVSLCSGVVVAWDVSGLSPTIKRIAGSPGSQNDIRKRNLVEISGDLHQVLRFYGNDYTNPQGYYRTVRFQIFKLELSKWVEVKTIGDHALFLGGNHSMALSAREYPYFRENCIYFTDDSENDFHSQRRYPCAGLDMGVFNLQDGSVEQFYPTDFKLTDPRPIWVIPKSVK